MKTDIRYALTQLRPILGARHRGEVMRATEVGDRVQRAVDALERLAASIVECEEGGVVLELTPESK